MSTRTMTLLILTLALTAAFVTVSVPRAHATPALPAAPAGDDQLAAIAKNTDAFAAAWNTHDAKSLAALWANNGDLIDPWGVISVGRESVEKFFAQQHTGSGQLAKSTYKLKSSNARIITPDVAVADWQVVLTGLIGPDSKAMGPMIHHVVIVWKKDGDKWEIAAARPGVPSPVPPPTGDATTIPKMPEAPAIPKAPATPAIPKMPGK